MPIALKIKKQVRVIDSVLDILEHLLAETSQRIADIGYLLLNDFYEGIRGVNAFIKYI